MGSTVTRLARGLGLAVVLISLSLINPGGITTEPVSAQAACAVGAVEIDCNDPGIVLAHVPYCAYDHYHGVLNGVPDPNPNGCGHGPVTRGVLIFEPFDGPPAFFEGLGWPPGHVDVLMDGFMPIDNAQVFRFADDPSGPPTFDHGFGRVAGIGAGLVIFDDRFVGKAASAHPCDNVDDPLLGTPGDDRILVLCGDGPLRSGTPYVSIFTQLEDQIPPAAPVAQNYSFFTSFGDAPTWMPLTQYPGDTWQGGSFFPYVTQEPGTGFFTLGASKVGPGNELLEAETGTVFVMGGDTFGVFIPTSEFPGLDAGTIQDFSFGTAVHLHDGSFGSCATCGSSVSVFPSVPRDGLYTQDPDFWSLIDLGEDLATTVEGAPTAVPTGGASIQGGSSGGSSTMSDPVGSSTVEDGGGFPLGASLISVVILAGVGGLWWQRKRFFGGGPAVVAAPGESILDQIEGGPPVLAAPPGANPPPSTFAGDVEIDQDLVGGVQKYFDAQDEAAKPTVTNKEHADWGTAMLQEAEAQRRLMSEFQRLLDQVNGAWAQYRAAVDRYRSKYTLMLSGSTEMQGMLATWAETRGIAQKQDLAFAIVTLLWTGGQLAVKGAKWATSGGRALAQTGDDAAAATAAVATYSSAKPSTFAMMDMLLAKRAAGMQRLAAEAGVDLATHMARYADDAEAGYTALLGLVTKARGWVTMTAEAENTICRLLVNGRAALAGRGALSAQDVAQLQRWAQTPGFWDKLAKSASLMDEVGWIGSHADVHQFVALLYTADDINFLRRLAETGGDLRQLGQAIGPAQTAALTSLDGTLAGVVANAPTFAAPGAAHTAATQAMNADPVSQMGDVGGFVDQFGITGKFGDLDKAVNAGDATGIASESAQLLGSELWDLVSSPFETYQEYKFTFEAQDVYDEFIKNHSDELRDMSTSLDDAYRALERLQRGLNSSGVGGNGPLNRRKQELRDVLDNMRKQYNDAHEAWREEYGDEFRAREAHITQKLAYVEGMEAHLVQVASRLPQMMAWLDSIRRPNGERRSFTSFIDPEIAVRLLSVQAYLDTALGSAYRNTGTTTAPSTGTGPSTPSVPSTGGDDGLFEDGVPSEPPYPEGAGERTQEEIDQAWRDEVERLSKQWSEFDALPEDYELDVDLNFDDLDPPAGQ